MSSRQVINFKISNWQVPKPIVTPSVQGDSIEFELRSPDVTSFDENWTGRWGFTTAVGKPLLLSGNCTVTPEYILCTVPPDATATLLPGTYYLIAEVTNMAISFRQEVLQRRIKLFKQGIA